MSRPVREASLVSGLMSGFRIQWAPRSNGTLKLRVSVKQRPPIRLVASTRLKLRAAAMPAAPAPTMITSTSAVGPPWPRAGLAASAVAPARKVRRLSLITVRGSWLANGFYAAAQRTQSPENPQVNWGPWPAPWFIGDYPEIVGMNRIETSSD